MRACWKRIDKAHLKKSGVLGLIPRFSGLTAKTRFWSFWDKINAKEISVACWKRIDKMHLEKSKSYKIFKNLGFCGPFPHLTHKTRFLVTSEIKLMLQRSNYFDFPQTPHWPSMNYFQVWPKTCFECETLKKGEWAQKIWIFEKFVTFWFF